MYARRKFDHSSFESDEAAASFDPMGWMVITRPNTGTSFADMSTADLHNKYRLILSCADLKETACSVMDASADAAVELVRQASANRPCGLGPMKSRTLTLIRTVWLLAVHK
jgi:hypothetical protein